jgi:uncharacterized protein
MTKPTSSGYSELSIDGNVSEPPMCRHAASELQATCAIAVMAKASDPGKTKTRLVPTLNAQQAAELNTAFLRDVADNLLAAAALANIKGCMAYSPAGSRAFFDSNLPASIACFETVAPHFGDCLYHAASHLLAAGYGSVCLLNSDSPTLPIGYLVAAATILAVPGDRVVVGPATDGGYYLVGVKDTHKGLFENVDWSTQHVFRQTLSRADALGLAVVLLPAWYDVDDAGSLKALVGELLGPPSVHTPRAFPAPAHHTRHYLQSLLKAPDVAGRLSAGGPPSRVA